MVNDEEKEKGLRPQVKNPCWILGEKALDKNSIENGSFSYLSQLHESKSQEKEHRDLGVQEMWIPVCRRSVSTCNEDRSKLC